MESPANPTSEPPMAGDVVPNSYIIILKDNTSESEFQAHQNWVSGTASNYGSDASNQPFDYTYNLGRLKGYAGTFSDDVINEIAARPDVAFVEPDTIVTTQGNGVPTESEFSTAHVQVIQSNPPSWGLVPISHRTGSLHPAQYAYDSSAGTGVTTYVLDTGIRITHTDFGGRAKWGKNFVPGTRDTDLNGHGTHVSGTIVGNVYGVAKRATVVAVKVLGDQGHGSVSGVIAGISWVVSDAPQGRAGSFPSCHDSFSQALNLAVDNAVIAGVTVVVSAGNDNNDACKKSPASAARAITVGATDRNLYRASYSNYGRCVTTFAPGTSITSCGIRSDTDATEKSGTSMASPHVAGVAAYLINLLRLTDPVVVRNVLTMLAGRQLVKNPGSGSPNLFLYNGNSLQ